MCEKYLATLHAEAQSEAQVLDAKARLRKCLEDDIAANGLVWKAGWSGMDSFVRFYPVEKGLFSKPFFTAWGEYEGSLEKAWVRCLAYIKQEEA